MSDFVHQQLLGHLLGALDDAEQERVDDRLEHDQQWCEGLTQWRHRLAPLEAMRPEFEPPPGLASRTCRFVASCMPTPVDVLAQQRPRGMSPDLTPPSRTSRFSRCDVAVVALLLVTAVATLLPAIHSSRFQSRVAACQNGLQQFGASLVQYGHQHGTALSRLASNGHLTPAGVTAAEHFSDGFLTDRQQAVCSDAWLASQGIVPVSLPKTGSLPKGGRIVTLNQSPGPQTWEVNYWPGTWRDGTDGGQRLPPSLADLPLLADAPSADMPGQTLASHGGRGRNVWFEDGHSTFQPSPAPRDVVDRVLSVSNTPSPAPFSAPIVFVNGR
jgi:hypothetical protein